MVVAVLAHARWFMPAVLIVMVMVVVVVMVVFQLMRAVPTWATT